MRLNYEKFKAQQTNMRMNTGESVISERHKARNIPASAHLVEVE